MRSLNISPAGEGQGQGGGGPEDDSRFPERTMRSHGLLSIAFGIALGLTLMIFFFIFKHYFPIFGDYIDNASDLKNWVETTHPNLWITFLIGFIGGTLVSAIYNFLVFRKFNLFGTERNVD
ncbi:hypothetical protein GF337_01500 [candidate division KSB1 bacterium]|nr:hypothetical protein [candidate division KSB1 bacterium]